MSRFAPRPHAVAALIRSEVLGLVTSHDAEGYISTPLPLLATVDENGEVEDFLGHFAVTNPHVARLQAAPHALVSFMGPHGYIAPAGISKPDWAPTWNYQLAQFEVEIRFEPTQGDAAIRALVTAMEGDAADAWTVERMGARYATMVPHVVAFRARVLRSTARFKLGQDESPTSFAEIVAGLGDVPLAAAMLKQAEDSD